MISTAQRILADRVWSGTGAGTFSALVPIHHDIDDIIQGEPPPSAAAALAIELGRPVFWAGVLAVLLTIAVLLRGSMERGRDSFYPAAGASSLCTITVLMFADAGCLRPSPLILLGATLGLALAQRTSHSRQLQRNG
jgi:hypothetical protein